MKYFIQTILMGLCVLVGLGSVPALIYILWGAWGLSVFLIIVLVLCVAFLIGELVRAIKDCIRYHW